MTLDENKIECRQCGGYGRVAGPCLDGCCVEQADPDCEICSHRCDICRGKGWLKQGRTTMAEILSFAAYHKMLCEQVSQGTSLGDALDAAAPVKRVLTQELIRAEAARHPHAIRPEGDGRIA